MGAGVHTFLVSLMLRAVRLLPRPVRAALDERSRRQAHERALRRQRASQNKR